MLIKDGEGSPYEKLTKDKDAIWKESSNTIYSQESQIYIWIEGDPWYLFRKTKETWHWRPIRGPIKENIFLLNF